MVDSTQFLIKSEPFLMFPICSFLVQIFGIFLHKKEHTRIVCLQKTVHIFCMLKKPYTMQKRAF